MAVRKERVELQIDVNGKNGSKTYRDLIKQSKQLKRELLDLTPGTDAFIKKSAELRKVNGRLADVRAGTRGVQKGMEDIRLGALRIPGAFRKWLPALGVAALVGGIRRISSRVLQLGRETLDLFDKQSKVNAQAEAVIRSTGQAAGRTLEDLQRQAQALQQTTLFGDEQTQGVQNILLTFTQLRGEIFDNSVPAVLDMATALDVDLKSAAIQVGKALNDPVKGVSALGRAGVQFSEEQKEVIKTLVDTGRQAEAQAIILKELETQFKGSAAAAAAAGSGPLQQLQNRYSDIKEVFGDFVNRVLVRAEPILRRSLDIIEGIAEGLVSWIGPTGRATREVKGLQSAFNLEIETLKTANLSQGARRDLITQINEKYREYLPRLISEKDAIEDLAEVQALANKEFEKRITLLSLEEAVQDLQTRRLAAKRDELNLQKELTAAQIEFDARAARATSAVIGKSDLEQRAALRSLEALNAANNALEENKKLQEELRGEYDETINAAKELGVDLADLLGDTGGAPGGGGGGGGDIEDPDKARKEREAALQAALQAEEVAAERMEAQETIFFNRREINEKQYQDNIKQIRLDAYRDQLRILSEFGEEQSIEADRLRVKISALEREEAAEVDPFLSLFGFSREAMEKILQARRDMIEAGYQEDEILLREKLIRGVISEEEFSDQMRAARIDRVQEELAFLRDTNQEETAAYREKYLELLGLQEEYLQGRRENLEAQAEREAELRNEILTGAGDLFSGVADLIKGEAQLFKDSQREKYAAQVEAGTLSKEEADKRLEEDLNRRRRSLNLAKAFELVQIKLKLAAEIQGIWKNANENPLNALIPGWGPAFAAVQTALALGRATTQAAQIARQKFEGGGRVPSFPAETGGRIEGPSHEGGGVPFVTAAGFVGEARGGEVILNEEQVRRLGGAPVLRRAGVPGFNEGGRIPGGTLAPLDLIGRVDTTPSADLSAPIGERAAASENMAEMAGMAARLDRIAAILAAWPIKVRAQVVYEDLEQTASDVEYIKSVADA